MALLLLDNTLCNRRLGCSSCFCVSVCLSISLLLNMCTDRLFHAPSHCWMDTRLSSSAIVHTKEQEPASQMPTWDLSLRPSPDVVDHLFCLTF